jgi:hypothetical protein
LQRNEQAANDLRSEFTNWREIVKRSGLSKDVGHRTLKSIGNYFTTPFFEQQDIAWKAQNKINS